ncbi:Alpha/Beta hydrolase protein [Pyrenochaeta sp. MPI-SDFR-AT-0127]|nr:Alpha/Beta hydrolase protein [Pyrenochaeta sp. MPI-SDFR-AT-0127]
MQSRLSFLSFLLLHTAAGYILPNPPGRYNVTLATGTITDYNRDARTLMLSVFQPATCASTVPKVFNISVDLTPLFLDARLPVCPDDPRSCPPLDDAPILLLSPGYRGSRLYYSVMASAIASEGFTLTPYAYARAADASFIIDQLSNATAMAELLPQHGPRHGPRQFSNDRVAMLGHSLGGASAVLAAGQDPRIRAAINWDGPFFGSLPPSGLSQPVLYVTTEHEDYPSWLALWQELKGPKLWIKIASLLHEGMLDLSVLLQAAGQDTEYFADLLGRVAPTELVHIMTAYAAEWMNGAFAGEVGGSLLQGQEPDRFPEVSTVRKDNF